MACPTFEWGGSDYSKSLSGGPALGGIMLRFTVSAGAPKIRSKVG